MDRLNKSNSKALALNSGNKRKQGKTVRRVQTGGTGKPSKKEPQGKKIARSIGRGILMTMLICIIVGCVVTGALALFVINFVKPYNITLDESQLKATSIIYATDPSTNKQVELARVNGEENRIWVDIGDVPKNLTNAIISTEDMRFNQHEGVDTTRTVSAFANMIFHFNKTNYGGSTLTQQVVKNLEGNISNRSPSVKLREIITALDVEKRYSKDQILEAYVNLIPLGNQCCGVQTAANMYFGKDVKDLDLAQCALLAGIIQAPSADEPYKHEQNALKRQKYVLSNMLKQKMITKAEYTAALNEKLTFTPKQTAVRGWFVDQVITDVENDLVSKTGCTLDYAKATLFNKGLRIYTTENPKIQSIVDDVYTNSQYNWMFTGQDNTPFQSAMTIVDYTGHIVAMAGGHGAKTQNMILNRATSSYRPAGSSFKPICTYALAIEKGLVNWSYMVEDSPPDTINGQQWPRDDEAWTMQNMTVEEALRTSRNAVAVRVEIMLGVPNCFNFLTQKLGFSESLSKDFDSDGSSDYTGHGLTLGIFSKKSKGASTREMASAYEIFGNGGLYYKPVTYTSVTDADGNVILQNKSTAIQAISPETSTIMNRLMQNVVTGADATGYAAKIPGVPVAGKTGTTPDNYDRWWVGLTPDYVGACWTGYDQPRTIGAEENKAVYIWQAVMAKVSQGRDASKDFPTAANVVQENYDPATGKLTPNGSAVGWYNVNDQAVEALKNDTMNTD